MGLQYSSSRLGKVSGGKGGLCSRKLSFLKPPVGSLSMLISALLCSVTCAGRGAMRLKK